MHGSFIAAASLVVVFCCVCFRNMIKFCGGFQLVDDEAQDLWFCGIEGESLHSNDMTNALNCVDSSFTSSVSSYFASFSMKIRKHLLHSVKNLCKVLFLRHNFEYNTRQDRKR